MRRANRRATDMPGKHSPTKLHFPLPQAWLSPYHPWQSSRGPLHKRHPFNRQLSLLPDSLTQLFLQPILEFYF